MKQSEHTDTALREAEALILEAIDFAIKDMDKATKSTARTISKIKK